MSPDSGSDTPRFSLTEQENSAAEGLLGLSDCGGYFAMLRMFQFSGRFTQKFVSRVQDSNISLPKSDLLCMRVVVVEDGVRRSNRKRRKNKVLSEYETGAIEGEEETEIMDDGATDPEAHPAPTSKAKQSKSPSATSSNPAANLSPSVQQMLMKMGLLPSKSIVFCFFQFVLSCCCASKNMELFAVATCFKDARMKMRVTKKKCSTTFWII